jgi:lysozyme family protein
MTSTEFNTFFDRLIDHEGGYVNDPKDAGGETKWGISKRSYPHLDIKSLTRDDAKQIYYDDFWLHIDADNLYDGVAWQLFDFSVNSGIQTAIRAFQRALNVADDGVFGPVSKTAATAMSETDQIMRINAERLDFMTHVKSWPAHSRGWARRIAANLRYGAIDS